MTGGERSCCENSGSDVSESVSWDNLRRMQERPGRSLRSLRSLRETFGVSSLDRVDGPAGARPSGAQASSEWGLASSPG